MSSRSCASARRISCTVSLWMIFFCPSVKHSRNTFSGKSSGDFDNAPGPKSPRDTPYGSRDKWQNKTHILSFNPPIEPQPSADADEALSVGRSRRGRQFQYTLLPTPTNQLRKRARRRNQFGKVRSQVSGVSARQMACQRCCRHPAWQAGRGFRAATARSLPRCSASFPALPWPWRLPHPWPWQSMPRTYPAAY